MPELMSEWLSLPQIVLTERQLFDLELLGNGGFAPLEGFLSEGDYSSVVEDMHLMDGSLWPIPIVLDIRSPHHYTIGQRVLLVDTYGNALAMLTIKSIYAPDREREAQMVYGTNDRLHPGVRYLLEEQGDVNLGGTIEMIAPPQHFDFKELRHTPEELKAFFKEKGWDKIVAFQTRNPLHRAHVEIIKRAAEMHDAHILLHPVVGLTKEGDIDYITRVRAYKALQENGRLGDDATLALLPLAMRMAGPREALLHALVRRNYGATHFIVGRDHAGPGLGSDGEPLYGPYEAQELALKYQPELGITIVPAQETVYVENEDRYLATPELEPHHVVKNISGTELRRMLRNNEEIPDWFSFSGSHRGIAPRRNASNTARRHHGFLHGIAVFRQVNHRAHSASSVA